MEIPAHTPIILLLLTNYQKTRLDKIKTIELGVVMFYDAIMDNQADLPLKLSKDISLTPIDRSRNILITGTSGVGVSTYFLDLITQDIQANIPIILLDQYGDLANRIIGNTNKDLLKNIVYIDIGNQEYPVGLNIFEPKEEKDRREIGNAVINLMYDLYDPNRTGVIGPRFEHAVRNAILTIMYDEKASFVELVRCLTDASYVQQLLPKIQDPIVRRYWTDQIAQTSDFHKSEVLDYIISKFGPFIVDKKMRYILGQTKSTIDLQKFISEGKTIIFDFGKLVGDIDAIKIVSSVLMVKLLQVLRRRACINAEKIGLYFDEAAFLPSSSIVEILRESRRYKVDLTLTTGKISEMDKPLLRELLNIGTLVSFRLSTEDAQIIVPEFHSSVTVDTLCMLKKYNAYIKYLQDGNPISNSEPVNLEKNEIARPTLSVEELSKIKSDLHQKYGTHFETVEQDIKSRISSISSQNN